MNQRDIVALVSFLVFVALIALAVSALRRRAAKQVSLGELQAIDSLTGSLVAEASGFYVSTVFATKPLERIVSNGLLHRGKATLVVRTDGLQVRRLGETSFAIASSQIREISRASATIDRGVEQAGLIAVSWMLGGTEVTTNFRLNAADDTKEVFDELLKYKGTGAQK